MSIRTLSLAALCICAGCNWEAQEEESRQVPFDLWKDATDMYLPVTAEWTNRAEVADLDLDGDIDILFANGGNYSEPGEPEPLRIFLNPGDSSKFTEVTSDIFGEEKFLARVVKVRDVNADSLPDIFIGTTYQTQSRLYLNEGNGKFRDATSSHLPQRLASIGDFEFGDADMDGDLDIVLTDWGPGNNMQNTGGPVLLWLNDGQGHFEDVTENAMPEVLIRFSWDIEFMDVDNDFDLDIAVSCKRCAGSSIFVNDGSGRFEERRMLPAYTNNYEFEPMDVNHDGFLDLVTVNDGAIVSGNSWSRREHLFLSDSGKYFRDVSDEYWPASENIGEDDNNIVFLDFDSDGDPDFLLSSLTGEDRLLVNDGDGHFSLHQPVLMGAPTPFTLSMVLADLNGDNKPDIVMGQGEGKDALEERIFLGHSVGRDTSPPVIALYAERIDSVAGTRTILARIHDNKSPAAAHDFRYVQFQTARERQQTEMQWYGEYLWKAVVPLEPLENPQICVMDRAGNTHCRRLRLTK